MYVCVSMFTWQPIDILLPETFRSVGHPRVKGVFTYRLYITLSRVQIHTLGLSHKDLNALSNKNMNSYHSVIGFSVKLKDADVFYNSGQLKKRVP